MSDGQFSTHTELFDLTGKRAIVTGGTSGIGVEGGTGKVNARPALRRASRGATAETDPRRMCGEPVMTRCSTLRLTSPR